MSGRRLQPAHGDRLVAFITRRPTLLAFGAAGCPEWRWLESSLLSWHAEHAEACLLFHVDLEANDTLAWDFGVHGNALLFFLGGRLEVACESPLAEGVLDAFLAQIAQRLLMS